MDDQSEIGSLIRKIQGAVREFETEAHSILSTHETSTRARVISVAASRQQLSNLTLRQEQLFDEALECITYGLFRAAHVSAWQAFIDFLHEKLASDGLVKLRAARPNWPQTASIDDLKERFSEYEFVTIAREIGLITRGQMKSLHGMLSTRNECAHPSGYSPSLNASLGFVTDLLDRVAVLAPKAL